MGTNDDPANCIGYNALQQLLCLQVDCNMPRTQAGECCEELESIGFYNKEFNSPDNQARQSSFAAGIPTMMLLDDTLRVPTCIL